MRLSFWSDEERWFVPRALGLGYSLNLKYAAKRLGWIHTHGSGDAATSLDAEAAQPRAKTREERLRERIDVSKHEDAR